MTRRALALLLVSLVSSACAKGMPSGSSPGARDMAASSAPAMADGGGAMAGEESMRMADDVATEKGEGFDPSNQAGTLTAGTFDDTRNPEVFRAFAERMQGSELHDVAAHLVAPITVVKVVDADGRPVSGARVVAGRTLPTRTDGRVVLTGLDVGPNDGDTIAVTVEHQGRRHRAQLDRGGASTIRLPFRAATGAPRALDVALVIDATGSMGDELEYLKVEIRSIAQAIDRAFPEVDQRFALVVYRDDGDEYVTRSFDFTADLAAFERKLGRQKADGGGDYPEAMDAALVDATSLSWREGNVARMTFLVADAPPHAQNAMAALGAADELRSMGVATYPVAASGVAAEAELVMRAAALMSGGQYVFLTDDSGVGLAHEEPHIPCYAVEHLRDAMTRMIRTELSGERVEADARRTVRTVGRSQGGVCETSQARPLAVAG
jgi:hypothetical protein